MLIVVHLVERVAWLKPICACLITKTALSKGQTTLKEIREAEMTVCQIAQRRKFKNLIEFLALIPPNLRRKNLKPGSYDSTGLRSDKKEVRRHLVHLCRNWTRSSITMCCTSEADSLIPDYLSRAAIKSSCLLMIT